MIELKNKKELIHLLGDICNSYMYIRDDLCVPYGITPVQYQLLLDISHNGKSKVTAICKRMHKSTNVISPLINRLIKKGLLLKEKDKNDTRVFYISITKEGKLIIDEISLDIMDYSIPCFEGVTDEEVEIVNKYLKMVLEGIAKWDI